MDMTEKDPIVIVFTGSRELDGPHVRQAVGEALDLVKVRYEVVSVYVGDAKGFDAEVRVVASARGLRLHVHRADWERHGRKAGPVRNRSMVEAAWAEARLWPTSGPPVLIGLAGMLSRTPGTSDCVATLVEFGAPVFNVFKREALRGLFVPGVD